MRWSFLERMIQQIVIAFYLSVFYIVDDFHAGSVSLIGDYGYSTSYFPEVLLPIFLLIREKSIIDHLFLWA